MLRVSEGEKSFIELGVSQGIRHDGRGPLDYRPFSVETSVIAKANGSSRVQLGHTDVLVGIKVEITTPTTEEPDMGRIFFCVECSPSASPEFEGRGAEDLNVYLTDQLNNMFKPSLKDELKKLCILPKQQCWGVYVDVLVLDSSGNLLDTIALAIKSAIYDTSIPKVEVVQDDPDEPPEIEVSDDPLECTRINVDELPLCVSAAKIGLWAVMDPSLEEEVCMACRLSVGITRQGDVVFVQKTGPGGLEPDLYQQLIEESRSAGVRLGEELAAALQTERTLPEETKLGFLG